MRTIDIRRGSVLLLLVAACGGSSAGPGSSAGSGGGSSATSSSSGSATSQADGGDGAGLSCPGAGLVYPMAADPDVGAVDVGAYCLGLINGYRAQMNLAPYWLQDTSAAGICCAEDEAEAAAQAMGHVDGHCGWQSQGFCGGGRNPNGTVQLSMDWCPKLFFQEGPTGGHYQAMMRPAPRGIMCSFYALSRDQHAIVVDYY